MTSDDKQARRNRTRMILFVFIVAVLAGSFVAILVVWRISVVGQFDPAVHNALHRKVVHLGTVPEMYYASTDD
jgi:hypothetical protein